MVSRAILGDVERILGIEEYPRRSRDAADRKV
jgi:hypothetical protein